MRKSADTILIVDARQDERLMYQRLLQSHGFRVSGTANLEEAAAVLRSTPVELIVLDLFLSRDNFAQFIGTLQRLTGPSTPILIVAAWMPSDVAGMAMRAGCSLMSKPVEVEGVIRAIRQLVAESSDRAVTTSRPTAAES